MQTLGLSDAMPRSEGRLKSLFWPSVQSSNDVDYLGAQGYWVCAIVGLISGVFLVFLGSPWVGALVFAFYFLSGVGVRERSQYAAGCVFVAYFADMLVGGLGIVKIVLCALLLANFRATWMASRWKPDSAEAVPPPRWNQSWSDKFADKLPAWLWPKVRYPYYTLSVFYLGLLGLGIAAVLKHRLIAQ